MSDMLMAERESVILEALERNGIVRLAELRERLGVTERTLRRDLQRLEEMGLLRRTRGGAVSTKHHAVEDPPAEIRLGQMVEEKRRIAAAAVSRIEKGARIILDSGTTTLEIARALPHDYDLSVVTNNVMVLTELAKRDDIELVLCGGSLRRTTLSIIGPYAEKLLSGVRADMAFVGVTAVTSELDFTTSNLFEAEIKKEMIRAASYTYIVCDRSKFGKRDLARFAGPEDVDEVITDGGLDARWANELKRAGIKLTLAS